MGNATVICSDKTGTLTQNVMTVVAGTLGAGPLCFNDQGKLPVPLGLDALGMPTTRNITGSPTSQETAALTDFTASFNTPNAEISMIELSSTLNSELRELLKQSIVVNTTAFEGEENGKPAFIGSKTETALLDWAQRYLGLGTLNIERSNYPLEQLFPFNSNRKCMGAVVRLPNNKHRMFFKGAPEIILLQCTTIMNESSKELSQVPLRDSQKKELKHIISTYASRSLRTIAIAYREFDQWPPAYVNTQLDSPTMSEFTDVFKEMTWLGVVAIQDPVRDGVTVAVKDCQRASVSVKMVTGDNIETARAIAEECGILPKNGVIMEGPQFRQLSKPDMESVVKNLSVLARSSPEDKRILVKTLKRLGEIVAVTGDGTNDAPALKAADVGFSMGIAGTEVAKEASDIILMDDNFSSIVKALAWGRTINDGVKKFLQFQVTVSITAVIVTFVSAVSDKTERSVLNAVQLLWVNLIMDTFAAMALATDSPTDSLLDRKPEPKSTPLISLTMWKMIIGQSIYQLVVIFIMYFAGPSFLNYPDPEQRTLVFNVFVWMQIFKLINSRRIDNRLNVFEGLHRNWIFMAMMSVMIGGQLLIIFVGGSAFVVTRLNGVQWAISLILGLISLPVGVIIRLIPDSIIRTCTRKFTPKILRRRKPTFISPDANYDFSQALLDVRDDLAFLKRIRGGRIHLLEQWVMHPREMLQHSRSGSRLSSSPMQSALCVPGLLAGSIGGLPLVEQPLTQRNNSGLLQASADMRTVAEV
jgi:Ca2+-transporting ATPase